jgi:hypothetical protein
VKLRFHQAMIHRLRVESTTKMQHSRRDYLHDVDLRGFELCAKRGGETSQRRLRGGIVQNEV